MNALLSDCTIKGVRDEKDPAVLRRLKAHCGGLGFVRIIELILSAIRIRKDTRKSCLQRAINELWVLDMVSIEDLVKWVDKEVQVSGDEVLREKTGKFIRQTAELYRSEAKVAEVCVFCMRYGNS